MRFWLFLFLLGLLACIVKLTLTASVNSTSRKGRNHHPPIVCYYCTVFFWGTNNGNTTATTSGSPTSSSQAPPPAKPEDIYLGYLAQIKDYPYTVMILLDWGEGQKGLCSGSIYSPTAIITAAHCVYKGDTLIDASNAIVFAGSSVGVTGELREAERIIPHPQYTGAWTLEEDRYDIAIIMLKEVYEFGETIQPIGLAPDEKLPAGTECILSAYGSDTGPSRWVQSAGQLQYTRMILREDSECASIYPPSIFLPNLSVCAGGHGQARQCSGDSGGPLIRKGGDGGNTPLLYGVVNLSTKSQPSKPGVPCSDPRPGTYAYAPRYTQWIRENAK